MRATVAIAQCRRRTRSRKKIYLPLEKAECTAWAPKRPGTSAKKRRRRELERQIRRLEDLVMPTFIFSMLWKHQILQPWLETLRKATVVEAPRRRSVLRLEKKLGTLEASRDKPRRPSTSSTPRCKNLGRLVDEGRPRVETVAKAEICRQLADDASNVLESIAVQVKAARRMSRMVRKAPRQGRRVDATIKGGCRWPLRSSSESPGEGRRLPTSFTSPAGFPDFVGRLHTQAVKKAELETLSQDADAIKVRGRHPEPSG